jgi:hypothetical protein
METTLGTRGRRIALAAVAAVAGTMSIGIHPAAADNVYQSYSGFVWAGQPTNSNYAPDAGYTSHPQNRVVRTSVGGYTVRLVGQGSGGGVAHVSGYGYDASSCQVAGWGPDASGVDQLVNVRCFNQYGAPADARFTASYHRPGQGATARLAYVWASSPTAPSYTPSLTYQRNPAGGAITIQRGGVGSWNVTIPGMATSGGNVQVTAYGSSPARCKVVSWFPSAANEIVGVACFSPGGTAVDVPFSLSFADRVSLFGRQGNEQVAAYAWAPATGSLPAGYSWHYRNLTNSIIREPDLTSRIRLPEAGFAPNHVQVTAYGSDASHCKIGSWTGSSGGAVDIHVLCFAPNGTRANSAYSLAYLGSIIPW